MLGTTSTRNVLHPPSFVVYDSSTLPVYRRQPDGELVQVDSLHVSIRPGPEGKVLHTPRMDFSEREVEALDPEMLLPASHRYLDLFLRADDIKTWVDRYWL